MKHNSWPIGEASE